MASEWTILINGANGGKFTVRSISPMIGGTYDRRDKTFNAPCPSDIAQLIPYRLRAAFARNGTFWRGKDSDITSDGKLTGIAPYCTLYGYRGKYLATLYAIPAEGSPA